jgi:predicted DNA-binding transcriptional regulator
MPYPSPLFKTSQAPAALGHKSRLLTILARHVGRGNGIRVKALAAQVGLLARQVRLHVSDLRQDGVAICGTPTHGYYVAGSHEELEETCQFLRSRALHSLTLESRLRKIPLPELLGQLNLRT